MERARPSDDAIVLAALATGRQWLAADDVRAVLVQLGFEVSTQQIAAWLGRLRREDSPMFEAEDRWDSGFLEYRVTRFGTCQLTNRFDGLRERGSDRVRAVNSIDLETAPSESEGER